MNLLTTISILLGLAAFFRIGFSHSYKIKSIKIIRSWLAPAIIVPGCIWCILIFCAGNLSTIDNQYNFFNLDPENYKNIAAGLGVIGPVAIFLCVICLDPQMRSLWNLDYRWKFSMFNVVPLICSLYVTIKYGPYHFWAIPGAQIFVNFLAVWFNYSKPPFRNNYVNVIDRTTNGISDSQREMLSQFIPGYGQQPNQDTPEVEWKNLTSHILCYVFLALYYIMIMAAIIVFTSKYCSVMPPM